MTLQLGGVRQCSNKEQRNIDDMRATVIIFFVLSVKAITSDAQTVCTAATGDPSHCKCDTPAGVIDVTSLGNPDKTAK